jgi:hypothetical protein
MSVVERAELTEAAPEVLLQWVLRLGGALWLQGDGSYTGSMTHLLSWLQRVDLRIGSDVVVHGTAFWTAVSVAEDAWPLSIEDPASARRCNARALYDAAGALLALETAYESTIRGAWSLRDDETVSDGGEKPWRVSFPYLSLEHKQLVWFHRDLLLEAGGTAAGASIDTGLGWPVQTQGADLRRGLIVCGTGGVAPRKRPGWRQLYSVEQLLEAGWVQGLQQAITGSVGDAYHRQYG